MSAPDDDKPTGVDPNSPAAATVGADDSAGTEAPLAENDPKRIKVDVIGTLKTCYDPEIPVDIYELGLIYEVNVSPDTHVEVKMTLTSPMCPVAGTLPPEVEQKVRGVHGVKSATVELVWDPPWDQEMMSEAAKVTLGMF